MLRYVLLALLGDGEAKHGYALMKAYGERCGVRISIGNIYRELKHLVADEWIAATENPPEADERRVPYTITPRGRAALAAWLKAPADTIAKPPSLDAIAYRVALVEDIDPDVALSVLNVLHAELLGQTNAVEDERAAIAERGRRSVHAVDARVMLLSRRLKHLAADVEVIDELRTAIAGRTGIRTVASPQASNARRGSPKTSPRASTSNARASA